MKVNPNDLQERRHTIKIQISDVISATLSLFQSDDAPRFVFGFALVSRWDKRYMLSW